MTSRLSDLHILSICLHQQQSYFSLFKASALWADAFYKSKCPSVCLSVCLFMCSLLMYRLNFFLPPFPEVGRPIFLEMRNPWGKVLERSGQKSPYNFFVVFLLILPYKTWWKPRSPMDQRPLVEGRIANFGISLDVFEFLHFWWFFRFSKKSVFWVFLVHPETTLPDGLETSGQRAYR